MHLFWNFDYIFGQLNDSFSNFYLSSVKIYYYGSRWTSVKTLRSTNFNVFCITFLVALIGVDGGNATRTSRFANYLRTLLPCNDVSVMELVAKAVGRLAQMGGTFSADYVEFEVKKALEWLIGDRHEGRRHAAVSIKCIF